VEFGIENLMINDELENYTWIPAHSASLKGRLCAGMTNNKYLRLSAVYLRLLTISWCLFV